MKDIPDLNDQLQLIAHASPTFPKQNRLVYSPAWTTAQQQLIQWALAGGLTVSVDDYGNVYADLVGKDDAKIVATGSHIDTVKDGGIFDGLYGILAGINALIKLKQRYGQPQLSLRAISFSEEEGSRFPTTFSGSRYYVQKARLNNLVDANGIDFNEARQNAVQSLLALPQVNHQQPALPATFTELHIEQGPILEATHRQIGLVNRIVGQRRLLFTLIGQANHAGTTPPKFRHDAFQAALELINQFSQFTTKFDPDFRFTIGHFVTFPNVANVIPGEVQFSVDFRHPNEERLKYFDRLLHKAAAQRTDSEIKLKIDYSSKTKPVKLASNLLRLNQTVAHHLNYSTMILASGAGHDSQIIGSSVPTAMIFVPSKAGISHTFAECTDQADLEAGFHVLTESLYQQAYLN
ncbi:M20 family metallo-hydrolase [Pediococcus acidilactici]|uniref:M20 family metallo-hydrolase n=1 Tax=Pediococcus acidilactici TaxID=1254 RepID=UPI001950166B|nr:M20 family metallo-hydrolase [Pediococcus acidilactici]MBM6585047.1 M20 family metallo-hydrolase [Pediococcus acidilactici]